MTTSSTIASRVLRPSLITRLPAVLVFPGQGSQWPGMAAELLDVSPAFTSALRQCAAAIQRYVGWDVEDVLRRTSGAPTRDRVEVVQPALFAVHVALAALWIANGLVPEAVVGQSQGEIAATHLAGALSLDDAARIITMRSQLFADTLVGHGGIASIMLSAKTIRPLLARYGGLLEVAGDIGPTCATVPGAADVLAELIAYLDVPATIVPASIPSHCWAVEPLRARLLQLLATVARQPVLFRPATLAALARGHRVFVFVESSAHPVLTAPMTASGLDAGVPIRVSGTLRRGCGDLGHFAASMADACVTTTPAILAA